jgi:hypothetical protein
MAITSCGIGASPDDAFQRLRNDSWLAVGNYPSARFTTGHGPPEGGHYVRTERIVRRVSMSRF